MHKTLSNTTRTPLFQQWLIRRDMTLPLFFERQFVAIIHRYKYQYSSRLVNSYQHFGGACCLEDIIWFNRPWRWRQKTAPKVGNNLRQDRLSYGTRLQSSLRTLWNLKSRVNKNVMIVMTVGTELRDITAAVSSSVVRHNSLNITDSNHKVVD